MSSLITNGADISLISIVISCYSFSPLNSNLFPPACLHRSSSPRIYSTYYLFCRPSFLQLWFEAYNAYFFTGSMSVWRNAWLKTVIRRNRLCQFVLVDSWDAINSPMVLMHVVLNEYILFLVFFEMTHDSQP